MTHESPSWKLDQFLIRFPPGLRDRVKAAAEANGRSMNSEIVQALEEAYPSFLPRARDLHREVFEVLDKIAGGRNDLLRSTINDYLDFMIEAGVNPISDETSHKMEP